MRYLAVWTSENIRFSKFSKTNYLSPWYSVSVKLVFESHISDWNVLHFENKSWVARNTSLTFCSANGRDWTCLLTLPIAIPDEEKKLNFYFVLLCGASKGFLKALKASLHKTFWGTTKKRENKNLTQFLFQYDFQKLHGTGRVKYSLIITVLYFYEKLFDLLLSN